MSSHRRRVLVVANRTASTPRLLEEIARRDQAGATDFLLLIPSHRGRTYQDWTPEVALRLIRRAVPHSRVDNLPLLSDAVAAVEEAVEKRGVDEIIVSTTPTRLSARRNGDLRHRVAKLGPPVSVIAPEASPEGSASRHELAEGIARTAAP
jgi:hypothetical protein